MSETFLERLRATREADDLTGLAALVQAVPFARFLNIGFERREDELRGVMRFGDHLIGNPTVPALHGGAIAALLETTAIAAVLWEQEPEVLPRPVTLTFDYLRPGRPADVFAAARVVRSGRRVCSMRVEAWQDDRDKPIAAASATLLLV